MTRRGFVLGSLASLVALVAASAARAEVVATITNGDGVWSASVNGLLPGAHTLIVTASDGSTEEVSVTVPAGAGTVIRRTGGIWRKFSAR